MGSYFRLTRIIFYDVILTKGFDLPQFLQNGPHKVRMVCFWLLWISWCFNLEIGTWVWVFMLLQNKTYEKFQPKPSSILQKWIFLCVWTVKTQREGWRLKTTRIQRRPLSPPARGGAFGGSGGRRCPSLVPLCSKFHFLFNEDFSKIFWAL